MGYILGFAAHALTDVNDSVGTMLLFPFTTLNWTMETWAYAATKDGGKYLDAAAYYSSLGLVMDLFWLVVVLFSWRVLTREYWRTQIVPADPHIWSWLGQRLPERALLALYRATFFYGVCRLLAWTGWAHVFATPVIEGVKRHRLPVRPVVDGAVVARRAVAPARPRADRAPGDAGPARARLLGGQQAVGADGQSRAPRLVGRRHPRVGGRHHVGAEHLDRIEVERAQEGDGAHVALAPGRSAPRRPPTPAGRCTGSRSTRGGQDRPGRGPPRWS